jgi:hypothetical protein
VALAGGYENKKLSADRIDRQVSRLRRHLSGAVEDVDQFIDRTKRGVIRLGVHPSLIKADRSKLMKHPNEAIAALGKRLPEQW